MSFSSNDAEEEVPFSSGPPCRSYSNISQSSKLSTSLEGKLIVAEDLKDPSPIQSPYALSDVNSAVGSTISYTDAMCLQHGRKFKPEDALASNLEQKSSLEGDLPINDILEFLQNTPYLLTKGLFHHGSYKRKNGLSLLPRCQRIGSNYFVSLSSNRDKRPNSGRLLSQTFKYNSRMKARYANNSRLRAATTGSVIKHNSSMSLGNKSSLIDKTTISSVKKWNMTDASEQSYYQLLEASRPTRRKLNLKRGAKSVMSTKRYLPPVAKFSSPHSYYSKSSSLARPNLLPVPQLNKNMSTSMSTYGSARLDSSAQKHSSTISTPKSDALHGDLRYVWEDGFPVFSLLLDNCKSLLIASVSDSAMHPHKEDYKLVYSFHSRMARGMAKGKGEWGAWIKTQQAVASLVGSMIVSSVLIPEVTSSGKIKYSTMFECVLFDGKVEASTDASTDTYSHSSHVIPPAKPLALKSKGTLQFTSILAFQPFSLLKQHFSEKSNHTSLENCSLVCQSIPFKVHPEDHLNTPHDAPNKLLLTSAKPHSPAMSPPPLELAAMVIRIPSEQDKLGSIEETRGWGLKFLKEGAQVTLDMEHMRNRPDPTTHADVSTPGKPNLSGTSYYSSARFIKHNGLEDTGKIMSFGRNNQSQKFYSDIPYSSSINEMEKPKRVHDSLAQAQAQAHSNVTIILPAGLHGLPLLAISRPSPLIERWRSGGKCDCGGWDMGCGFTVLTTEKPSLYGKAEAQECRWCNSIYSLSLNNSLKIFPKREGEDVVMLCLEVVQEGHFSLRFKAHISPLVAFAIAVAILHSKESKAAWIRRI